MFLPLGFEHSYERRAWVTGALVGVNVLVYVLTFGWDDERFLPYALDPENFRLHQLVTSAFLHAGIFHLAGNLLFLWVFGRYVEDRLGPWRFGLVYLAFAVASGLAHLAFDTGAAVGASGAISGLEGYVLVAAPWLEMRFLFFVGFYGTRPFELAVGWLLVFWAGLEVATAVFDASGGVAVAAHLGGFGAGVAAAALMRSRFAKGTGWYIDPRPPRGGRAAVERLRLTRAAGVAARR